MYGKKAGTLRHEQARLQHELQDVNGKIEKARKDGEKEPPGDRETPDGSTFV